jgi:hypothetical protein
MDSVRNGGPQDFVPALAYRRSVAATRKTQPHSLDAIALRAILARLQRPP